jgi:hypothetical protein
VVKPKGENPSPSEESQYRIFFRVLLEIEVWSFTLINESTCSSSGYIQDQFLIIMHQGTISDSTSK